MLNLDTKQYDVINVGPDVMIRVLRISRGRVRLGIEAPREMKISRETATTISEEKQVKQ